jgi:predicted AlkP superfamily pyrophosphatase or phosphodiesterase
MDRTILLGSALIVGALPGVALAEPVLMISIDGLQPADVIEADKRGINIPNLKRFVREGSYAAGVTGVLPTVTYPSHTTLLTGASPARHGVVGNTTFDPMQVNQGGWYWYARDIRVATLWDAAAKAGLSTASVHWPVSVGATSIRWNIPQIWRTGHSDDAKLIKALATPGLVEGLEAELGPYAAGIDESIKSDENRGAFAVRLIAQKKPEFATVYLTALDHEQHEQGPDTKAAHAVLERIDAIVGKLLAAQLAAHPDSVVAVVSDHGFAPTTIEINLFRAFVDAKLIAVDADGKVKTWEAMPWPSGGSIAIMLAHDRDAALEARVAAVLDGLKADPQNRISAIARRPEIAAMGGNPEAAFYLNLSQGAVAGAFKGDKPPLVGTAKSKGMHGYFPATPAMRSSFMMMGPHVPKARNLGEIDMRTIAPTLARIMGVALPEAEMPPLP